MNKKFSNNRDNFLSINQFKKKKIVIISILKYFI